MIKVEFPQDRFLYYGNFADLYDVRDRYLVMKGGAGSGKSHAIAQKLIERCIREDGANHRFLITRKTQPSLRKSCFALIKDKIREWNMESLFHIRETDMSIACLNGNKFIFTGLDDVSKLKSIERITGVWAEEANEIQKEDFLQLDIRLRGDLPEYKQIILSFNPVDEQSWINSMFFKKTKKNSYIHESTVDNNVFADQEYIDILDSLADEDENYYKIYRLGLWGVLRGLIYTKHKIVLDKNWPDNFDETIYGLDFGYNNPSCLMEINVKDQEYYLRELLYKSKLTNSDLIKEVSELIPNKKSFIYADSAEPARIEEFERSGFKIFPSNKSVKDGIDFCKRKNLNIHEESIECIKEIRAYKWKEDKNGNPLDEPVKFNDHACDGFRYPIYTHFGIPQMEEEYGGFGTIRD